MAGFRDMISKVMPKTWAAQAEAESRQWMIRCEACGYEQSVWDAGGMRWKAAGSPRIRRTCPGCHTTGWHTLVRKDADGG